MDRFKELNHIIERLLGPGGCPWDQEQTLKSMRSSALEEACELSEAIDSEDNPHILEELGDLFFNAVFLCKLAEKEMRFHMDDVLKEIADKLVRRHPHVFGDVKLEKSEEVLSQWEQIKKQEKGKGHRKSVLDSIPKGLPSLLKARKILKKIGKEGYHSEVIQLPEIQTEEQLGKALVALVAKANESGMDAEHALQKEIKKLEKNFRKYEENKD